MYIYVFIFAFAVHDMHCKSKKEKKESPMFKQMDHPHLSALQRDTFVWNLSNVLLLEGYIHNMDGDPLQGVVKAVLKEFKTSVLPNRPAFRKCMSFNIPNC